MINIRDDTGKFATVQYAAVCLSDTREVLPSSEGTIQDGTMVDQYGDPELMASFAEHYLSGYRAAMPSGRPPNSVVEMMPALHLLVMAVELVMKADLMRSEKDPGKVHSLERLYKALDGSHSAGGGSQDSLAASRTRDCSRLAKRRRVLRMCSRYTTNRTVVPARYTWIHATTPSRRRSSGSQLVCMVRALLRATRRIRFSFRTWSRV